MDPMQMEANAAEARIEDSQQPDTVPGRSPVSPSYIYAIGQIQPRFPSLAVEKEFSQATGRAGAAGLTDRQAMQTVLADRANRYLVRQLCWVYLIEGVETYLLQTRDPADLDLLVDAIRTRPEPADLDVVIGILGPLAPPDACGLVVPVVAFDQIYSFDRDTLLKAIPMPEKLSKAEQALFSDSSSELLDRVLQLSDNVGATDEHRALNYLVMRYPAIYAKTASAYRDNSSLTAVEVIPSRLRGVRNIVDVVFSYTHRQTDVTEKFFIRVDVTEEFPFLITKLSPFFDRA